MRNLFLRSFIVSLVAIGAFGIFALIGGKLGEFEVKILISTLAFIVYSLTGLCCSSLDKSRYPTVAMLGVVAAIVGLVYAIATTWFVPKDFGMLIKGRLAFLVISIAFAHASLLLLIDTESNSVKFSRSIAILAGILFSFFLVYMLVNNQYSDQLLRTLGIIGIVGVVATVSSPILHKVSKSSAS